MTLIEAIKKAGPSGSFKREKNALYINRSHNTDEDLYLYSFTIAEILADDWEVKPVPREFYIGLDKKTGRINMCTTTRNEMAAYNLECIKVREIL